MPKFSKSIDKPRKIAKSSSRNMSGSYEKSPLAVQKRNEPSPMKIKKSNEISKDVLQNKTKRSEVEKNQHHEVINR